MYVCHLILLEKVISFTMANNLRHIQKIRNTLFQPFEARDKNPIFSISNIPARDHFAKDLVVFAQIVETVETLYYKLLTLSFWAKCPAFITNGTIYRVVVLLSLISIIDLIE